MSTASNKNRFRVEKVELQHESSGPDYFTSGEFQVIDCQSSTVVARFVWSLDETYLASPMYRGTGEVKISEDGSEAIAVDSESGAETRVALPGSTHTIACDGVSIGPETDIAALVRRIGLEDAPPVDKGWRMPAGQWLWKLYERLGQTRTAQELEAQVAALLDAPEPRLRACALRFYYYLPHAPHASRLWELARTRRDLFSASLPGHTKGNTLDDDLVNALQMRLFQDTDNPALIALARAESVAPSKREGLLVALGTVDQPWVIEHATEIARAAAERWKELLIGLQSSDQVGIVARKLVSAGLAPADKVLKYVNRHFTEHYYKGLVVDALKKPTPPSPGVR